MCESTSRLIAWMDGELAENEAAIVERHVHDCAECNQRISVYEEVSRGFAAYYCATKQAPAVPGVRRRIPRWVPVAAGVAAAVAAVLLLAFVPRPVQQVPSIPQVARITPPAVEVTASKSLRPVAKRHFGIHRRVPKESWATTGPAIQISIPADSMFPPGAVPEGMTYIANLSLTPDGSVQGLRLQP